MTLHGLALLLLVLPLQEDPYPLFDTTVADYQALKDVATLLELCDRSIGSWGSYHPDLNWCRSSYHGLTTAPRLWHSQRLPPLPVCQRAATLAKAHLDWLEHQQGLYPYRDWDAALTAARRASHWWATACVANNHCAGDLRERRLALAGLRDLIGEQAWDKGEWPLPVPVGAWWRGGR